MELKITRSKRHLMDGLLHMLKEKDYNTITISEICQVTKYNRGTFYNNFNNKNDLLNFLIDSKLHEIVQTLNEAHSSNNIDNSTLPIFEVIYDNGDFFQSLLNNNTIIGFRYKIYIALLDHYFKQNMKIPRELNKYESIEEFYFSYVVSAVMGITMYWIKDGMKKSPQFLTEKLLEIVYTRPHDLILGNIPFHSSRNNDSEKLDPRVARTKSTFKDVLIMLMQQKSYNKIKINEIIHLAEYNRSTFYSHFESKNALYKYMVSELTEGMIQSILPLNINHNKVSRNNEGSSIFRLFNYWYENRTLLNLLYCDNNIPGFFNEIYMSLYHFFVEELEGRSEINTEIYSHYLTSTLLNTKGTWFVTNKIQYSPLYLSELFEDILKIPPAEKIV